MQGLQLCTDWKLVAIGELSLGLGQSGAESMCQKVVRGWPLSKQDRSPQGPRKSPQQQSQDSRPGSWPAVGRGQGEVPRGALLPLCLSSEARCCRPARETGSTGSLAGRKG